MLFSNAVDFLKNNYDVKSRDTGDVFKDLADVLERNKKRLTQANEWITPVLLIVGAVLLVAALVLSFVHESMVADAIAETAGAVLRRML